jgi:predicted NodU family carbamoyl transferase
VGNSNSRRDIKLHCGGAEGPVSLTGSRDLCLAGGVALHSKANGLILSERLVDRIFIPPAAMDDGAAIGVRWLHPWRRGSVAER